MVRKNRKQIIADKRAIGEDLRLGCTLAFLYGKLGLRDFLDWFEGAQHKKIIKKHKKIPKNY